MRLRNLWFDWPAFLVAAIFAAGAIGSIVAYRGDRDGSLVDVMLGAAAGLLIALVYLWMSLAEGAYQEKRRKLRARMKQEKPNDADASKSLSRAGKP